MEYSSIITVVTKIKIASSAQISTSCSKVTDKYILEKEQASDNEVFVKAAIKPRFDELEVLERYNLLSSSGDVVMNSTKERVPNSLKK